MFKLIGYEFKKIWNKVSILAILLMVLLCIVSYLMIAFDSSNLTIKSNGEAVRGSKAYRTLKNESKDIKGVMDQNYLDNLVKQYNMSKEKQLFNDGDYPLIKYKFPNFIINFANYGQAMGNFYIDLDFDFLKSEKDFYKQYKDTVKNIIKSKNEGQGRRKYTQKQISRINKQVDNIKTPFNVEYDEGLSNFVFFYGERYWIVLIVIAFALSTVFSKDSTNGIDELSLSSTFGRKKI